MPAHKRCIYCGSTTHSVYHCAGYKKDFPKPASEVVKKNWKVKTGIHKEGGK